MFIRRDIFSYLLNKGWTPISDFLIVKVCREIMLDIIFNGAKREAYYEYANLVLKEFPLWNSKQSMAIVWTENHLVSLISSGIILNSIVGNEEEKHKFIERAKVFLSSRLNSGFSEMGSTVYSKIFIHGLLNLWEFSGNDIIIKQSEKLLGRVIYILLILSSGTTNPEHLNLSPATTRTYLERFRLDYSCGSYSLKMAQCALNGTGDIKKFPERMLLTSAYDWTKTEFYEEYKLNKFNKNLIINTLSGQQGLSIYNYPIWVQWSYGHYFTSKNLIKSIELMDNSYFRNKIPRFIRNQYFLKTISPLLYLFTPLTKFLQINGMNITMVKEINENTSETMVFSYLTGNTQTSSLGAQQLYWSLVTNHFMVTSNCGKGTSLITNKQPRVNDKTQEKKISIEYPDNLLTTLGILDKRINVIYDVSNTTSFKKIGNQYRFKDNSFQVILFKEDKKININYKIL